MVYDVQTARRVQRKAMSLGISISCLLSYVGIDRQIFYRQLSDLYGGRMLETTYKKLVRLDEYLSAVEQSRQLILGREGKV